MKNQKYRLLAIIAHPDDEILFAGLLLKLKKKGWDLFEIILTEGGGGVSLINIGKEKLKERRKKEGELFAKLIGIKKIFWLKEEDGFLSQNNELIKKLVVIIRKIQPDLVILLNPEDYHKDHRESYNIGINALEIATRKSHLQYGNPLSTVPLILISDGLNLLSNPDIIVDVSGEFSSKINFIKKAYVSQISSELLNFVKGVGRARGARIKVKQGEAFAIGKLSSCPMISSSNVKIIKEIF